MTIAELQQEFLTSGSQSIAPEDFFILLAHSLRKEKIFVLAHPEYVLDRESESRARIFFARRVAGEPVALTIGHKAFYGRDFLVTKDTLIPRPETELLVELVLGRITNPRPSGPLRQSYSEASRRGERGTKGGKQNIHILDIGTGTGNIIVSIASELIRSNPRLSILDSQFSLYATDISEAALAVAQKNAKRYDVDKSIKFLAGDLLEPLSQELFVTDEVIITANLPYLSRVLYQNTPRDVRLFELKSALLSGEKGLDHYTRLLQDASNFFPQESALSFFLEISPEQSARLQAIASHLFPGALLCIHRDLANKPRVLEIRREKNPL